MPNSGIQAKLPLAGGQLKYLQLLISFRRGFSTQDIVKRHQKRQVVYCIMALLFAAYRFLFVHRVFSPYDSQNNSFVSFYSWPGACFLKYF
jgi:hypothetical protein